MSSAERNKITILQGEGLSIRKIAKELGRSSSTILRELNRPQAMYYRVKYIGYQTDNNVKKNWSACYKINKKTASKTAKLTITPIVTALRPHLSSLKSITDDNGNEFSMHGLYR